MYSFLLFYASLINLLSKIGTLFFFIAYCPFRKKLEFIIAYMLPANLMIVVNFNILSAKKTSILGLHKNINLVAECGKEEMFCAKLGFVVPHMICVKHAAWYS